MYNVYAANETEKREILLHAKHCGGHSLIPGLTPPLILLVTWIPNIGFCVPGNQQINANMVNDLPK